jgi:hypothetical protein
MNRQRAEKPVYVAVKKKCRLYGITVEFFYWNLRTQGRRCANRECLTPITERSANIDHDHSCCDFGDASKRACGKCFRGLLCPRCNKAAGHVADSARVLRGLANYLDASQQLRLLAV